jgi:hypothetical protein
VTQSKCRQHHVLADALPTTLIRLYELLKNDSRSSRTEHPSPCEEALQERLGCSNVKDAGIRRGGGERDRTDDPLLAKQVLSQLSYTPIEARCFRVVGLVGFEPTTPALSRRCSNRLSYRPLMPVVNVQPISVGAQDLRPMWTQLSSSAASSGASALSFPERR